MAVCPVPLQLQVEVHGQGARGDSHQRVQSPVPALRQDLQHQERAPGSHNQETQQQGPGGQAGAAEHALPPPAILTYWPSEWIIEIVYIYDVLTCSEGFGSVSSTSQVPVKQNNF